MNNIILIGFCSCGKSATAYELAKRLTNYGLFGYFPLDTLAGFTALIVRRALEE